MKAGRPPKNSNPARPFRTLASLRISKRQSADWQKIAQIPPAEFEQYLADGLSTSAMIRKWHGAKARRLASLGRMAAELRAAGWTVFPPVDDAGEASP
jgi:hypothetical protein